MSSYFSLNIFVLSALFVLSVACVCFLSIQSGIWTREPYSTVKTRHENLTMESRIQPIIEGMHVAALPDEETVAFQHSFINQYNYETLSRLVVSTFTDSEGYRNASEGHLSLWTTNSNGQSLRAIHVDSEQNVGVGTEQPQAKLHVIGEVLSTVGFNVLCDERVKTIIGTVSGELSSQLISFVVPQRFKRLTAKPNENSDDDRQTHFGFMAQDFLLFNKIEKESNESEEHSGLYLSQDILRDAMLDIQTVDQISQEVIVTKQMGYTVDQLSLVAHLWNSLSHALKRIDQLETMVNDKCK